jgi:DNA modification methylase
MTNLTFVKGSRDPENLDPVSAAILEVASTGTSIFDPVVCEIAYRWFCPLGGAVLDPFAGGSVRGIVASKLGRPYTGIDLRAEQIDANRAQADQICGEPMPRWVCGDSREVMPALAQNGIAPQFDFVFSCPPYADLEVYSDDPRDLSTLEYDEFRAAYASIIAGACALLKPDRFACFVVGDVRDRQGFYRNFPGHTIAAFEAAGLRLYNEAILVTAVGSLPIRAGKQFAATRKLGKTHQNCLVFVKGDPRKATEAIGEVEFGELASGQESPLAGVEAL